MSMYNLHMFVCVWAQNEKQLHSVLTDRQRAYVYENKQKKKTIEHSLRPPKQTDKRYSHNTDVILK